jgi:hypothetical protein
MQLKIFLVMTLVLHHITNIKKQEAHKIFKAFLQKQNTYIKSKNEYDYRFNVFLHNLKEIEKESYAPKLDDKGRPLIGLSFDATSKAKGDVFTSYEREVNKFSILTDKEFANLYLMSYDTLYGDRTFLQKRKQRKYTFGYFKKYMQKFEKSIHSYINNFESNPTYNSKSFYNLKQFKNS